jgi:hypothetical protein
MRKIIILILIKIFMILGMSFPFYPIYDDVDVQGPIPTPTYSLLVRNPTPMPTPTPWGRPKCDPWFLPYPYDQDCQSRAFPRRQ